MAEGSARFIGFPIKRSEDPRLLTGRGCFIDDVVVPDMFHAAFLRSPVAHARVARVDTRSARRLPGVLAVFTGADMRDHVTPGAYGVPGIFNIPGPDAATLPIFPLAVDKVRFVGDPIVLVVAESRCLAEDACDEIDIDYEELPAVMTISQALDPTLPALFEELGTNLIVPQETTIFGDIDAAFARADRVLSFALAQHRYQNVPLECRGVVASYEATSDELVMWSANQAMQPTRQHLSARLGLSADKIRVRAGDIGGSFGLKVGASREDVAVAFAARSLGCAVKWIEDRVEHMCASGQARDEVVEVEAAVRNDGEILGVKLHVTVDAGAYPGIAGIIGEHIRNLFSSAYRFSALSVSSMCVASNKATYIPYRGPWAIETFVRERLIDLVARELDLEPLQVRLRNVVEAGEGPRTMVNGRSLAGVTVKESLERAAALVDVPAFRRRQAEARAGGRYLGLGIASFIEPAPGTRKTAEATHGLLGPEVMRMVLTDEGRLEVFTGQMPHGQGHETTIAQVAAEEFGVWFEDVRVVVGDTEVVPSSLSGGSLAATMAGGASRVTARLMRRRVVEAAGNFFEANPNDIEISYGWIGVRGDQSSGLLLSEFVSAVRRPGRVSGDVDTAFDVTETYDGGVGGWSGGTHVAIVDVDVATGLVDIEQYLVVEDCGDIINPAIVDGQIRGGVAQGIGAVLLERSVYDESGQFLSSTLMDYLLPTAPCIPRIEIEHLPTIPLDPDVNFRGVGEGGLIVSTATLCNAIEDAMTPFGVRILEEHLPPARILELAKVIPGVSAIPLH